jgi:methionine salvage enolase-phosphatase E1
MHQTQEKLPRAILLDIEGTVAPISFVHQVLFPYARQRMEKYLRDHWNEPAVAAAWVMLDPQSGAFAEASLAALSETIFRLMDADQKSTGLKRAAGSYTAIATKLKIPAAEILFISDIVEELRAAAEAGMRGVLAPRPQTGPPAGGDLRGQRPLLESQSTNAAGKLFKCCGPQLHEENIQTGQQHSLCQRWRIRPIQLPHLKCHVHSKLSRFQLNVA